jgi:CHAT domain-containing protein/tetratricopeptide (TPR) repeat protein
MKRRLAAAALALVVVVSALIAFRSKKRTPPTEAEIEEHLSGARNFERAGDLEAALAELEQAAEGGRERDDSRITARALNQLGALRLRRGENGEVRSLAEEALEDARRAKDSREESEALFNLGSLQYSSGRMREAMAFFEDSSEAARRAKDPLLESRAELHIGKTAVMMESRARAEAALERAKSLSREHGDVRGEAEATRVLGQLYSRLGENQRAIESFEDAQTLLKPLADPETEATIWNAIGQLYFDMGETETALRHYRKALELNQALQFRRREAATVLEVGRCLLNLGRYEESADSFERALALYRELENPMLEADVLQEMGRLRASLGDEEAAFRYFEKAIELKTSVGDLRGRSFVLDEMGSLHRKLGNHEEALRGFLEAAKRSREAEDPLFESLALYHASMAQRDAGRLAEARVAVEESIRLTETLRAKVASRGLRTSFLASVHERYSLYVDLLVELHAERPGEGLDALAFQAAERVRARALRESLQEAAAGVRAGIEPTLLERDRELRQRLNDLAIEQEILPGGTDRERLRSDIDALSADYDRLQSTIRSRSPRYAALTEPDATTLEEVQELLDDETRLLAYHLGTERSFLWSIGKDGYSVHELPPGDDIEALARETYLTLKSPGGRRVAAADSPSSRLSRMLLAPLADVHEKRLVIVADGALSYVPFGALNHPRRIGEPLIEEVEIARLPSASLLRALREQRSGREFTRWVAIVADPAYGQSVRPLRESRREATRIAALAPPGGVEMVAGFDARREWIETKDFRGFRALHLATHGVVDDERPELSGIVLALVDENGAPRNGFLRLPDIYNLSLPVDLVVLSACETGLGKEVKGEGILGLVRGFMYAGAPAVIASSWKVDDTATSELMTELYRGIFAGKSPAAALREAQVGLRKLPRFRSPYYWAAFELQGDWR